MPTSEFLIFLPVRNGGGFVETAIESVLAQTYPHWRLVILENASTDDTAQTLTRYHDPRISIRPAPMGLEIHANWRRGLDYLRDGVAGDTLVTFVGHDDLFYADFFLDIAALATAHPEATLYQTLFDLIDANGRVTRPCRPVPERETWTALLAALCWNVRDSFGTGYVFRAADYLRVGGIPDLPGLLFADHLLFTRLTRLGYKACTDTACFAYRRHGGSMSGGQTPAKLAMQVKALTMFYAVLTDEFAEFASTDLGKAAIAVLLARDLSLFESPMVRRALPAWSEAPLKDLEDAYRHVAGSLDLATLAVQPQGAVALLSRLRRWNVIRQNLPRVMRSLVGAKRGD